MLKTDNSFQAALADVSKRAKDRAEAIEQGRYPVNPDLPQRLLDADQVHGDRLDPGNALWPYYGGARDASTLTSQNGDLRLILQTDGNLVVYRRDATVLWCSWTQGRAVALGLQQGDGNFVLYGADTRDVYFATWTQGHPGAHMVMQNDGNLVIYDAANKPRWHI
jgi:hypothetical protein